MAKLWLVLYTWGTVWQKSSGQGERTNVCHARFTTSRNRQRIPANQFCPSSRHDGPHVGTMDWYRDFLGSQEVLLCSRPAGRFAVLGYRATSAALADCGMNQHAMPDGKDNGTGEENEHCTNERMGGCLETKKECSVGSSGSPRRWPLLKFIGLSSKRFSFIPRQSCWAGNQKFQNITSTRCCSLM